MKTFIVKILLILSTLIAAACKSEDTIRREKDAIEQADKNTRDLAAFKDKFAETEKTLDALQADGKKKDIVLSDLLDKKIVSDSLIKVKNKALRKQKGTIDDLKAENENLSLEVQVALKSKTEIYERYEGLYKSLQYYVYESDQLISTGLDYLLQLLDNGEIPEVRSKIIEIQVARRDLKLRFSLIQPSIP